MQVLVSLWGRCAGVKMAVGRASARTGWFYLLEAAGLDVQLVSSRDVADVPGRPESGKLDCVWQAKLTERRCCGPASCRLRGSGRCATIRGCGLV